MKIDYVNEKYVEVAKEDYEKKAKDMSESIQHFLQDDGSLDGSKMRECWFPDVKFDVFISHSHKDKEVALTMAYFLQKRFKLKPFIDSCMWGYSDKLLKHIDNRYCYDKNSDFYRYEDRNYSTSHIHMMLASALTMAIDKAECLFFLNTPNSLSVDNIESKTYSPWIYHEILISKYIRRQIPERRLPDVFKQEQIRLKEAEEKDGLKITHSLDLSGLVELSSNDYYEWIVNCNKKKGKALNYLYNKYPGKL